MGLGELFLLAVGLSMDAFAVSVCKGLSTRKLCWKHYLITGLWFGGFQALMPTASASMLVATASTSIVRKENESLLSSGVSLLRPSRIMLPPMTTSSTKATQ